MDTYLTADQVAIRLHVSVKTVRNWLAAGLLRGTRLSRRAGWRVTEADLAAFLAERTPTQKPEAIR